MAEFKVVIADKLVALAEHRRKQAVGYDERATECRIFAEALHDIALIVKDESLSVSQMDQLFKIVFPHFPTPGEPPELKRITALLREIHPRHPIVVTSEC